MAVMQEMLSSVLLAALASPLLAGALASENREHIHGAQRSHPRHRLPGLSGKDQVIRHRDRRTIKEEVGELLAQVDRDLEPWKESGITLEMVEKAYCTEAIADSMRIQVINDSIYVVGQTCFCESRSRTLQLQIADLHSRYQLPDVDFVMTVRDRCKPADKPHRSFGGNADRCQHLAPLFNMAKLREESHCVLMPDFSMGGWPEASFPAWALTWSLMSAAADRRPFHERADKIFWRGTDISLQRQIMGKDNPVQDSPLADVHLIAKDDKGNLKDFTSLAQHCRYKYLLSLSGLASAVSLKYLLLCGSVVIFPHRGEHEPIEFWSHLLEDKHNIVLTEAATLENEGEPVLTAVEGLRANQSWAEEVAAAGRHLAAEILHPDHVARYWMELLTQYSALQTFIVTKHTDAVPLDEALLRPPLTIKMLQRTCTVC